MSTACAQAPPAAPRIKCHALLGWLSVDEKAIWHPGCWQRARRQAPWGSTSSRHPPASETSQLLHQLPGTKIPGPYMHPDQGPQRNHSPGPRPVSWYHHLLLLHSPMHPSFHLSPCITGHRSHHQTPTTHSPFPLCALQSISSAPFQSVSTCLRLESQRLSSHPLCRSASIYRGVEEDADKHSVRAGPNSPTLCLGSTHQLPLCDREWCGQKERY